MTRWLVRCAWRALGMNAQRTCAGNALRTPRLLLAGLLAVALPNAGCASRAWNALKAAPATVAEARTYGPVAQQKQEDTFIVLAFSEGGTRSAAFAYGVLEGLRDTEMKVRGRRERLLDQVDVISAVSGAS